MNIDELKFILLNNSLSELKAAIIDFDLASFDRNGNNILHYYVMNRTEFQIPVETIMQLFIDFGININAKQSKISKRTALHIAVLKKSKDVFDVLLNKGADVNIKDGNGNVALFNAVFVYRNDDGYFIKTLIANGAHVDVMNNYGVSPKGLAETIANYDVKKFFQ